MSRHFESRYFSARHFSLSADRLAEKLIGSYLVHRSRAGTAVGQIVETEAYLREDDPAAHSHRGQTLRNQALFLPGGHAYVYFIYGMYDCFNIVSGKAGHGEGVLIRALRPIDGIDVMEERALAHRRKKNRKPQKHIAETQLCNGPGKLVIAMGINRNQNGVKMNESSLLVLKRDTPVTVSRTTRIGISVAKDLTLRFFMQGSEYLSR